ALQDVQLPEPAIGEHDLLVEVKAISVNPVDVKVRANMAPEAGQARVLGWDAAGVVRAVGAKASLFQPGDRVWYAGALQRPGANSELHAVDERIVGHMPDSLDFETAAALPLTAITAWELLFDRLQVLANQQPSGKKLLVVGAAGGVGSILVQLARQLTGLTVIGTASRPETQAWVKELGAHHVIDHSQPLSRELKRIGVDQVDYVASLNQTDQHFGEIVESLAPQGKLALIDDPAALDVAQLKRKSLSLHWEFMYTRSMFATDDQIEQHKLLTELARLVDAGIVKSTVAERFGAINAANLKRAHALLESNTAKGKIVLAGF
ncbi:zinc-binding alcohol dehydrogenase family protein, partial [Chromobacterium vaccinii]|uniref:zinc-binding alcohol dehydrogenase family protein n=1 Tax=Chromobacterium vaccinii TaxID=1108595 RepID=UPI001E46D08F